MFNLVRKKGVTLLELLIASALLGFVVIAGTGIDLASRRSFIWADRKARVSSEASLAMEHMVRNIRLVNEIDRLDASGNPVTPTHGTCNWVRVRMDYDPSSYYYDPVTGRIEKPLSLKTPDDFADDYEVEYKYESNKIEYRYRTPPVPSPGEWSTWEIIAERIVDPMALDPVRPVFDIDSFARPIFLTIDITAAYNPSTYDPSAIDPNNPGAVLHSGVNLRSRARD